MITLTEAQVRQLRAIIYGECSDKNWEEVRHNWMRPDSIKWLKEKASKPLKYA